MHSSFSFTPLSSFKFVCRGEKEFDSVAALRRPLDGSLGIGRALKLPAIPLTTPAAAVIHKESEKNKAGRSSQKAPFPSPTGNYFFHSPGASASQTTES